MKKENLLVLSCLSMINDMNKVIRELRSLSRAPPRLIGSRDTRICMRDDYNAIEEARDLLVLSFSHWKWNLLLLQV